jgi:hypothetical protein
MLCSKSNSQNAADDDDDDDNDDTTTAPFDDGSCCCVSGGVFHSEEDNVEYAVDAAFPLTNTVDVVDVFGNNDDIGY